MLLAPRYVVFSLAIGITLSGCVSNPATPVEPPPEVLPPPVQDPDEVVVTPVDIFKNNKPEVIAEPPSVLVPQQEARPEAVVALLGNAKSLETQGSYAAAAAKIERAMQISGRDAELWKTLASIRLQQGRYKQAEDVSKKSIRLSAGNSQLIAQNWRIIAEARKLRGDTAGARQAIEQFNKYQR